MDRLTADLQRRRLRSNRATLAALRIMWREFTGDPATFPRFSVPAIALIEQRVRESADDGVAYYRAFRLKMLGEAVQATVPAPPPHAEIETSLGVCGLAGTYLAIGRGLTTNQALAYAFTKVARAATRHVANGARFAIADAAAVDPAAHGYRRHTTGTCDFCEMCAAEGLHPSEEFPAHDGCQCTAEPVFKMSPNAAAALAERAIADGGFTVDVVTGAANADGYGVALQGLERAVAADDALAENVLKYAADNAAELAKPGNFFGAWHDDIPTSSTYGKVVFDTSRVFDSVEAATEFGTANGQTAIFDFKTFETIDIRGAAKSAAEWDAWATDRFATGDLTAAQTKAVTDYTSEYAGPWNRSLRGLPATSAYSVTMDANDLASMKELDAAIQASVVPEDVTVYRGLSSSQLPAGWEDGAVVTDPGYVSTTLNAAATSEFSEQGYGWTMDIKVPAGAHARYITMNLFEISGTWGSQNELILPRGTRFLIKTVDQGAHHVVAEVLT